MTVLAGKSRIQGRAVEKVPERSPKYRIMLPGRATQVNFLDNECAHKTWTAPYGGMPSDSTAVIGAAAVEKEHAVGICMYFCGLCTHFESVFLPDRVRVVWGFGCVRHRTCPGYKCRVYRGWEVVDVVVCIFVCF